MTTVNIQQAKADLSKLIAEVEAGGEVVITRGKTLVAKLNRVGSQPVIACVGRLKGQISLDERFFDRLPDDELALWNGEGD